MQLCPVRRFRTSGRRRPTTPYSASDSPRRRRARARRCSLRVMSWRACLSASASWQRLRGCWRVAVRPWWWRVGRVSARRCSWRRHVVARLIWVARSSARVARSLRRASRSGWCASCSSGVCRGLGRASGKGCWLVRPARFGRCCSASRAGRSAFDTSFAVLHGLYWLTVNLADRRPLLIAVDDAHWADEPSLRWLAYLAPRLEGLAVALLVALRPGKPASEEASLAALRAEAPAVVRPGLLSEGAVGAVVRAALGRGATDELCAAVWEASGGNPLYVTELLRARRAGGSAAGRARSGRAAGWRARGGRRGGWWPGCAGWIRARCASRRRWPCWVMAASLRHAAAIAGVEMAQAIRLAAGLVRLEVLAADDPPRFIHPVVRDAVEGSLESDERDAAHRSAARLLHADGAPPGQVAAHLVGVRPAGDGWVLSRLREAARAAMQSGAPAAAAGLLGRALAEPPPLAQRVEVLREAAQAEASAGRETACDKLEEALRLATDPRERAEIALEVAEAYAALFRWVDAVDVIERALRGAGRRRRGARGSARGRARGLRPS